MKFIDYVKEKVLNIIILAVVLLFIQTLLYLLKVDYYAIYLIEGILLVSFLILFFREYFKKRGYYKTIYKSLDTMNKAHLLCEVLEEPDFLEGKLLYDILNQCNKSMNDEVALYKKDAKEYQEYIEMWIHEVKTPIASTKLIIKNNPNEVTNSIEEEIDKVDSYLEQALYYARSSNASKDYIIKEVELNEVVNEVIRKNAKVFIREKIKLDMKDLSTTVYTDIKWTGFILNQIINNSIKYKSENPVISISMKKQKHSVILMIEDNGIGISASDLPRVTEKGYTGTTGRKYAKSTGIGLYLCQTLCDKLGLSFTIQSKLGEGTKVEIVFPREKRLS